MSISFDIKLNKSALERIRKKIIDVSVRKLRSTSFTLLPSIQKWLGFVNSKSFAGEFGVVPTLANKIAANFNKIMLSPILKVDGDTIIFKYLNINNLRQVSTVQWTSKKNPSITVNAIDVYEYGTMPTINNYEFVAKGGTGRSGLGRMERSSNSFSFFENTNAPQPFGLRRDMELFAQSILSKFRFGAL